MPDTASPSPAPASVPAPASPPATPAPGDPDFVSLHTLTVWIKPAPIDSDPETPARDGARVVVEVQGTFDEARAIAETWANRGFWWNDRGDRVLVVGRDRVDVVAMT